ncbi:hypothetical protein EDD86DRAFT_208727 [Gorgonomyces haynaldii]|nr:hypothetical protein EDD86DRAFT_208727 [Gorgonomyces haynaldii]
MGPNVVRSATLALGVVKITALHCTMAVSVLSKVSEFGFRDCQGKIERVHWCISPSLVKEATRLIQMLKEGNVSLVSPQI